jgi:dipeptidyl aminopeptidase/acylaminoacyl peptidase
MPIKKMRFFSFSRRNVIGVIVLAVIAGLLAVWLTSGLNKEEIVFESSGERLVGTLIKPKSQPPWPAVVFTHYSGKQTRDTGNYRRRAELFAQKGIAAFIYDRRGRGESSGDSHRFIPFQLLAADAVAAVEILRSRQDITPNQIGVAGHSQGGWVAPLASTLSDAVAFVMVSSAAGITPDEQNLFVLENGLVKEVTTEELERLRSQPPFERVLSYDPDTTRTREFFLFDPAPVWVRVSVPVFGIWSANDKLVPAEKSRQIIETALRTAGNNDVMLKVLPDGDHDLEGTRAEDLMIEWLLEHVMASNHHQEPKRMLQ